MKKNTLIAVASAIAGTLLLSGITFAATGPAGSSSGGYHHMGPGSAMPPGIFGSVTAVNGDTLTVQGGMGFDPGGPMMHASSTAPTPIVYTVNAANATVMKNGTSSSLGSVSVGDKVTVRGTVNGTSVAATAIMDGVVAGGPGKGMWNGSSTRPTGTRPMGALGSLKGNGEPVVGGTVSAVNGSMLTVTNASNVTYSIDASNATVVKGNATSSVANIAVNDNVIVQGTVNGAAVAASSVIDQGAKAQSGNGTSTTPRGGFMGGIGGFLGGIGSFFHNLFGFF